MDAGVNTPVSCSAFGFILCAHPFSFPVIETLRTHPPIKAQCYQDINSDEIKLIMPV